MKKPLQVVSPVPKDMNVVLLLDYYGGLLPEKQRRLVEYYYCSDLSLAEISENESITRQGARDSIVRAVKKLREYEAAVGFVKKALTVKRLSEKYLLTKNDKDWKRLAEAIEEM